ncbi:hypothetical protein [Corallococcus exiguus]|uniref:Uncharacterized protein n=1 Tax=Corallococcus exiguus TaxID=83462 RepID=A0A7X5BYH0_9BACT|nr:hypothetical protein [Corallococcus exiguus]NBC45347.1 hypothetical protein [Corallococcus exiguus]TNV53196.1 hypothetical protein FH620_36390 [Corallococcus exiguus]
MNTLRMRSWIGNPLQVLLLIGLVAAPAEVLAQKLCFRDITGLPGTPATPSIDGEVNGDPGWNNAFRYVFENGTNGPHAAVQGLRSATDLYLSFEVQNDPTVDNADVIVLTFNSGAMDEFHRIHIFPFPPGLMHGPGQPVRELAYNMGMSDDGATVTWGEKTHPGWIEARRASSDAGAGSLKSWNVEMRIPINRFDGNSIGLPQGVDFSFFFAILRVDTTRTPTKLKDTVSPFRWPPTAPIPAFWDLDLSTPSANTWGLANLGGGGCGGVFFGWNDIETDRNPTSKISLDKPNKFSVTPHNNSADPAQQVSATFKIANFGISAAGFAPWALIGATPARDIPANTANTKLETGPWVLSDKQKEEYDKSDATRHQCIYVELDAKPGAGKVVNFVNRSASRNMDFGLGSVYKRTATIDTRGFSQLVDAKPLPGCKPVYRMELVTSPSVREQLVRTPEGLQHREEMNLLYHGYIQTDRIIRINQTDYQESLPVASYGYAVVHTRPATPEEERSDTARDTPVVTQKALTAPAPKLFQPEELIPGHHWKLDTTLQDSSRPPTPPNCPGLKVTIPPAGRPGEGPKSQVITMEIPQDEAVLLGTRAEYQDKPTHPPLSGCGCKRAGQTAGSTAMLGLLALGFLSSRRRRGKNE